MRETQETISKWAVDTFGTSGTNKQVAERAKEELDELGEKLLAFPSWDKAKIASEVADVFIVLMQLAARMQFNALQGWERAFSYKCDGLGHIRLYKEATKHMNALVGALEVTNEASIAFHHTSKILWALRDIAEVRVGFDLMDAIDAKMAVNRARKWDVKNGFGQHIPDGTE